MGKKQVVQFNERKRKTESMLAYVSKELPDNIAITYVDKNKNIQVNFTGDSRLELMGMLSAALIELWAGDD